ncbi:MAG: acyltransferase family protein [Oscillospiraceae bacterium]|nr:acyltransferase family protein [Oscillospiraceae bacterium]
MTERLPERAGSPRIEWIDICKGLLIILMVLGHTGTPVIRPLRKWIYSFHMSAFLFLSGYTAGRDLPFGAFMLKRMKRILVPYVVWNLAYLALYAFLISRDIYLFFDAAQTVSFADFFRNLATTDLGGATWFLPVIFEISLIYRLLQMLCTAAKRPEFAPYLGALIGVGGFYLCDGGHYLPYMLDLALYGLLYYSLGSFFARNRVLEEHLPAREMTLLCAGVSYLFGMLYQNASMQWPTREFAGILENLISSISGIYVCYRVSVWLCGANVLKRGLSFFGKHTLEILIFHFAAYRVVFCVMHLLGWLPAEYMRVRMPQDALSMEWLIVPAAALALCAAGIMVKERCSKGLRKLMAGK